MSIDNPSEKIVDSVQAAIRWLDEVKCEGIRLEMRPDPSKERVFKYTRRENPAGEITKMRYRGTGNDLVVVQDPSAPPMWGAFLRNRYQQAHLQRMGRCRQVLTSRDRL